MYYDDILKELAHPAFRGGINISWDLLLSKSCLRWGFGLG